MTSIRFWKRDSEGRRRNVVCALGVMALALSCTVHVQASPSGDDLLKEGPSALEKVLEKSGCVHSQLDRAGSTSSYGTEDAPLCLGNVPLSWPKSTNDPAFIKVLAATAYVWGLGPEYIERFSKYNTIIGAPFNSFKYGSVPAAWNNEATNAGDASVLYISGFIKFAESSEQVLTVPPSKDQYYVAAYLDAYANTVGSIGTRTTPSEAMTSYLLVGPKSKWAKSKTAKVHGHVYPVMASDTDVNWFVIRVLANTLIDASDPTSVPNVLRDVAHKFALNSLQEFEANGHQPVYPANFVLPPPTDAQKADAAPYQNAPESAVDFFTQVGNAVANSPIPKRNTALSGTPLTDLPTWVVPQAAAQTNYIVPSYGQKGIFDKFAAIGLTESGFQVPPSWGDEQQTALQCGYVLGQKLLQAFINEAAAKSTTNYWGIVNDPVGTYPNNAKGYLYRSIIVAEGGVANIGLDAVYPTLTGNPTLLDGNHSYKLTFMPSALSDPTPPVKGIYPPTVNDANGNPKGFWSIHVYAVDPTQANSPFIAQTSVLNTSYSIADTAVVSVNSATNYMTVNAPNWGPLVKSTPLLFGQEAASYGLKPNAVYYVATAPQVNSDQTTYTFQISTQWLQNISSGNVPIQAPDGKPGPIVHLLTPTSTAMLKYGMVKPVTQLGSSQLSANQLAKNADGSLTMWFGPRLPAGAPASNWIPTPSTGYYGPIYPGIPVSTAFQLTLRMYYPKPGNEPPSILPCTEACGQPLPESYIPPALELLQ